MPKGYRHLTYEQRCQLFVLLRRVDPIATIAKFLRVHRSTIYRELKRNQGQRNYRFKQAERKACERRYRASSHPKKMTPLLIEYIKTALHLQWSPEQITGRLRYLDFLPPVCHETIYKYIWDNKREGGDLFKHLRHNGKKYNRRRNLKKRKGTIPNRRDIDERPDIVNKKCRLGDWEVDTVIGKAHRGAIVTMVERASKLTKLAIISQATAQEVKEAFQRKLSPLKRFVMTITSDNGKEFAYHEDISKCLGGDFFFAKPYHSWERGLNEHTNGLLRQYFPKKTSFKSLTEEDIEMAEILLNTRPRKVLNYKTPIEAFVELSNRSQVVALHS